MDVANVREQVVFDLKIQSAAIPRKPAICIGKIPSGSNLMLGKRVGEFSVYRQAKKANFVANMSGLKDQGQQKTGNQMGG